MLHDIFNETNNSLSDQLLVDGNLALPAPEHASSDAALKPTAEGTGLLSRLDDLDNGSSPEPLTLHLNILKHGKRFLPCVKVPAGQCSDFTKVLAKFEHYCSDPGVAAARIMTFLPDGLVEIKDDAMWKGALKRVEALDWMDGELKVLLVM